MDTAVIDDLKGFIEQKIDDSARTLKTEFKAEITEPLRQQIKQSAQDVMAYVGDALEITNETIKQAEEGLRQEIQQSEEGLRGEIKQNSETLRQEIKQSEETLRREIKQSAGDIMAYVGDALDITNETVKQTEETLRQEIKQSAQEVMAYMGDALDVGNAVRDGQLHDQGQRLTDLERRTKAR